MLGQGAFCIFLSPNILEGWFQNIKTLGRVPKILISTDFASVFWHFDESFSLYRTNSIKLINTSLLI
jgi:hypothetical protein